MSTLAQASVYRVSAPRTASVHELTNEGLAACPDEVAQDERDDDRVVELARDGDEVRDEIERQREVSDERQKQELAPARGTRLACQPRDEHDAVRDESG